MSRQPTKRSTATTLQWIILLVPVLVALLVLPLLLYTTYASRHAEFVISPTGLSIRGSLYGRTIAQDRLLVQEARIVNLDTEPALQPVRRTNGTSVPGWEEGWFLLPHDRKALLFVTNQTQVVCLPTADNYLVLLSPTNPDVFLATLQRGTNVAVSFRIASGSSSTAFTLAAICLSPLLIVGLVIWPIARILVRQGRPFEGPTNPDAIYADRLVEITNESILFRDYYFPAGSKRVRFDQIDHIQTYPLTVRTGSWRIWGSGDFRTWFPADSNRPSRDAGFLLIRRGKMVRIGFTVEDSTAARQILRRIGLLREEQ